MKIQEAIAAGQTVTGDEPFCYFLAVMFPAHELKIMEYNRVVRDLNGLSKEEFLKKVIFGHGHSITVWVGASKLSV